MTMLTAVFQQYVEQQMAFQVGGCVYMCIQGWSRQHGHLGRPHRAWQDTSSCGLCWSKIGEQRHLSFSVFFFLFVVLHLDTAVAVVCAEVWSKVGEQRHLRAKYVVTFVAAR
jgi:hypothetical protein